MPLVELRIFPNRSNALRFPIGIRERDERCRQDGCEEVRVREYELRRAEVCALDEKRDDDKDGNRRRAE